MALGSISRSLGFALALAAISIPAAGQGEGFLAEYKKGVQAHQEHRWRDASDAFRKAITGRRKPSPRLTRKLYLKPYLPHFYLGSAYFHLGNCPGAVAAWNESERFGVIVDQPQFRELRQRRALCSQRLNSHADELARAQAAIEAARKEFIAVSELSEDRRLRGFWNSGRSSGASRRRRAEQRLSNAERRLEQGRPRLSSLAPLHQAASVAKEAGYLFRALREDAETYRLELERQEKDRLRRFAAIKKQSRQALREAAALAADSPRLRELRQRLRRVLDRTPRREGQVSAQELGKLEVALSRLRRLLEAPDTRLQAAARDYLEGHYGAVLELLVGAVPTDRRSSAQTLLLRAAAAFSLHRETPGGRPTLVSHARADLRTAARDLPEPPGSLAFSPAFRAFFAATVAPLQEASPESPPNS